MSALPKPTIQQAVAELQHRDEFKVIVQFLRDERERFFADLRQAETPNDVMKLAGSTATLDEIIQLLQPA
jgi:histidinol-phosphate/aromatic aminotransferase/cobyric acid decarboxylase-like protein